MESYVGNCGSPGSSPVTGPGKNSVWAVRLYVDVLVMIHRGQACIGVIFCDLVQNRHVLRIQCA